MNQKPNAGDLARKWINCWNDGKPDDIPLSEDFTHSSPFGIVSGRKKYLEWVKPLAAKNVVDLRIVRVIENKNQAAIHFDMVTPAGVIPVVDWIEVKNGEITKIQSFYNAAGLDGLPDTTED